MALLTKQITKLYKDLDLAFTLNSVTGDVAKKIDVNAVSQSLKILILTNFYERSNVSRPKDFVSNIFVTLNLIATN